MSSLSQNSSTALTSASSQPEPSTQTPHPALEITEILDEIFAHIERPHELLHLRLVCQKWNDIIVHTFVTKRKNSFPLQLRYGSQVPPSLHQSVAERWTRQILESPPALTLTGATMPLSFDAIVVGHDFCLAGVNTEWQHFLAIYGESIRHLKFNIRSGEDPEENSHHVTDCAQVVSTENLRAAFSAMPNLESLDFSIRFTHYRSRESECEGVSHQMFPEVRQVTDVPQLRKLNKITIQEPYRLSYVLHFLIEILGMAPNLTTLYLKRSKVLSTYLFFFLYRQICSFPNRKNSLTTLGISMDDDTRYENRESNFTSLHLTKLELNHISNVPYLAEILQSQSSTLVTLILGDRVTPNTDPRSRSFHGPDLQIEGEEIVTLLGTRRHMCRPLYRGRLALPPRMDSLKILEVNLPKFKLAAITSYPVQFPRLEELTLSNCEETGCVWAYHHLVHMLPGFIGHGSTVKKFSLLGPMGEVDSDIISHAIWYTFPFAERHFSL